MGIRTLGVCLALAGAFTAAAPVMAQAPVANPGTGSGSGSTSPTSPSVSQCNQSTTVQDKSLCNLLGNFASASTPSSPAFTILNVTPSQITRPTTPNDLGIALLSGADPNGNYQSGLAIDTSPYMVFNGQHVSLYDYQQLSPFGRALANTQVSIATAKGSSSTDKSMRASLGVSMTMLPDNSDPRVEAVHVKCVGDALQSTLPPTNVPPPAPSAAGSSPDQSLSDRQAKLDAATQKCDKDFQTREWNASGLTWGAATVGNTPDGTVARTRYGGSGAWTSGALRIPSMFGVSGQALLAGRWQGGTFIADPKNAGRQIKEDSGVIAAQLRLGSATVNFSFEPAYIHAELQHRGTENYAQFTLGAEIQLLSSSWLELSFGGTTHKNVGGSTGFVLGSFKWGFSPKPTMSNSSS